jgi:diguanylate cyclase (GGDEF)-like protein
MLGIESRVRGAFAQMQRGKIKKITVVAIDLDNFKRVNDTYGHKSGDKVLAVAGEILLHSTRLEDIVAHLSGDEFLILFCDTEDSHVEEILLRAKKKLSTRYFSFANGKILTNFTYGCASSASDKETFESLYHSADMDCNRRKRSVGGSRFKSLLA